MVFQEVEVKLQNIPKTTPPPSLDDRKWYGGAQSELMHLKVGQPQKLKIFLYMLPLPLVRECILGLVLLLPFILYLAIAPTSPQQQMLWGVLLTLFALSIYTLIRVQAIRQFFGVNRYENSQFIQFHVDTITFPSLLSGKLINLARSQITEARFHWHPVVSDSTWSKSIHKIEIFCKSGDRYTLNGYSIPYVSLMYLLTLNHYPVSLLESKPEMSRLMWIASAVMAMPVILTLYMLFG